MPGSGDGRYLGVAVSEVRVDGELLDLTNDVFGPGFHELEQDTCTAWRWTDGRAQLALDLDRPAMVEIAVAMTMPAWTRPAPRLRIVKAG